MWEYQINNIVVVVVVVYPNQLDKVYINKFLKLQILKSVIFIFFSLPETRNQSCKFFGGNKIVHPIDM